MSISLSINEAVTSWATPVHDQQSNRECGKREQVADVHVGVRLLPSEHHMLDLSRASYHTSFPGLTG